MTRQSDASGLAVVAPTTEESQPLGLSGLVSWFFIASFWADLKGTLMDGR